jgi:hypothetical protein
MQTSAETQELIPNYKLEDVNYKRSFIDQKTLYLGNLCARGDIESITYFINTTESTELTKILNNSLYEFYFGTVLHVSLYWNYGEKCIKLFEILLEHGAVPNRDYYGNFPWQQKDKKWNVKEFEDTYNYLRKTYELDEYEDEFIEL